MLGKQDTLCLKSTNSKKGLKLALPGIVLWKKIIRWEGTQYIRGDKLNHSRSWRACFKTNDIQSLQCVVWPAATPSFPRRAA